MSRIVQAFRTVFTDEDNVTLLDSCPILFMHLMCIVVPFTGFSITALIVCMLTHAIRVFALTAGYHRYFFA